MAERGPQRLDRPHGQAGDDAGRRWSAAGGARASTVGRGTGIRTECERQTPGLDACCRDGGPGCALGACSMTATTRKAPLSGGRLAAVVGGITSLMLAALLLLAGTGLLWADSRKDDDGYFSTVARAARDPDARDRDRRPRDRRRADAQRGPLRQAAPRGRRRQAGVRRDRPLARRPRLPPGQRARDADRSRGAALPPALPQRSGHARSGTARRADLLGRLHGGRRPARADVEGRRTATGRSWS